MNLARCCRRWRRPTAVALLLVLLLLLSPLDASLISYNISEQRANFVVPGGNEIKTSIAGKCPVPCICSHATVICTSKSLTTVPKGLPANLVRLDLQENKISAIKRTDFVGLHHLKILQIMDNEIQTIEEGSFDSLISLERLRLNRNRLRALPDHLFRRTERLHRLDLSENYLSVLTDEQLRGPRALHALQLDRNQLACVDVRALAIDWAESLEVLTLNSNSLNTLGELTSISNLRILRLSDNPWHCDCRLTWMRHDAQLKPSLAINVKCARPAMLQGRLIDSLDSQQMKCSGMEKRAATSCSDASVCPAVCACTETTVDCHDRGLKHIPANLPATTTELRLEQNHITSIPRNAFQNLKQLVRLDLSKNNIQHIASGAFNGLKSLNTLMLYANALTDLPADAFAPTRDLQLLLLNTNKLTCVRTELFAGLRKLNLLSLYDNQLRSIAPATFYDLHALQTLHLARNPLICDCNMEWLGVLLAKRAIETSGARCAAPRRLARRRLASISPSKFHCKGSEEFVTRRAGECIIDFDCPAACFCHSTIVDCSGRDLTEIPDDIPRFATELLLGQNSIRELTVKANLHHLINLEKIDLSENQIAHIEHNTFDGMTALREINLTANRLHQFSTSMLGSTAASLSILILNKNLLQCVTASTFDALTNLRLLSLTDNQLRGITEHTFARMAHLHSMYLAGNQFSCDCHLADFVRFLRTNASETLFDHPTCVQPTEYRGRLLVELDAEQLTCTNGSETNVCVENGNYCPAGCTCVDTVVRCSNRQLHAIPTGIATETTELYLDNNLIDSLPQMALHNLTNLVKLDLSQNRIVVVENGTFATLSRLSTLILSYNRLRCLETGAFNGLRSLRILSLHANQLSTLPELAFASLAVNLSHIAIGANALHCDCALIWFSRWIKARFIEPGIAKCETPDAMHNQLMITASTAQFKCDSPPPRNVVEKCDACAGSPCLNDGTCTRGAALTFTCVCPVGYHGARCEHAIDACYGAPCLNGATCELIQEGRFQCHCALGYSGERCETNIDDCVAHACRNGAECVDGINTYECRCPAMFAGRFCEERLEFCTPSLNPCANGALCERHGSDNYTCKCSTGFGGRNCTINIDDCDTTHKCRNGGLCVDGIGAYTCKCALGFSGEFCETRDSAIATDDVSSNVAAHYTYYSVAALSRRRDLSSAASHSHGIERPHHCSPDNCHHGYCDFSLAEEMEESRADVNTMTHGICRCAHGYNGNDCARQTSVGFSTRDDAYVALERWSADANGRRNLTFTLRTMEKTGVLVYYGDIPYIALELFDGRIKATFYVGNYPSSHMYSYAVVNDGRPHVIQMVIIGRELSLIIDGGRTQRVLNSGKIDAFEPHNASHLYMGGFPRDVAHAALAAFHVKDIRSLRGCVADVRVNSGAIVDFAAVNVAAASRNTAVGCASSVDLCAAADCGKHGHCALNISLESGYRCECTHGYVGPRCEKRNVECVKEKFREHIEQADCRSVELIKSARCVGWCGTTDGVGESVMLAASAAADTPTGCCAAVRAKRRRIKMHCRDGGTRVGLVSIVRKCACRNECSFDASPALVF